MQKVKDYQDIPFNDFLDKQDDIYAFELPNSSEHNLDSKILPANTIIAVHRKLVSL